MRDFLNALGEENFYKGDASEYIDLLGHGTKTTGFAVVEEDVILPVLLSIVMRYSPDEIRIHLLSIDSTTNLFAPVNTSAKRRKDMDKVDALIASGNEGDYGFIQIQSASIVSSTEYLVCKLRKLYKEYLLPACTPGMTLVRRRIDAIRKHPAATTWREVQSDMNYVFEELDVSAYRELIFINLNSVDIENPDFLDLMKIIYMIREFAGCNVIFVTDSGVNTNSILYSFLDTHVRGDMSKEPVELEADIVECMEKNSELCSTLCTSEWR